MMEGNGEEDSMEKDGMMSSGGHHHAEDMGERAVECFGGNQLFDKPVPRKAKVLGLAKIRK